MNRVWVRAAVMAAVLGMATDASAAKKPDPSAANWVAKPTGQEVEAAFAPVVKPGLLYRAIVRCAVADDGALNDCKVQRETPVNSGVGAAVLTLMPKYRRKPPGSTGAREVLIAEGGMTFDKPADWLRRPTPDQLLAVFPTDAFKRGQSGKAIINCVVTVQGVLADCAAIEESPVGAGFGGAAIALTPQFLLRPATKDGKPVPSVVNMPINFITSGRGETFGSRRVVTAAIAWTEAPTYEEVAAAYPAKARAEKKGGRATLACDMTREGRLARCETVSSEPRGYGFDSAAKVLAKRFLLAARNDADREAAGQLEVHIPIVFDPAMLDAGTRVVGKPSWAVLPAQPQLLSAFKDVKATGVSRAMLDCAIRTGGFLEDCRVTSETPTGQGVGAAALALASSFRLTTWTAEGLPVVGGRVSIPIRYEGGEAAKPAS